MNDAIKCTSDGCNIPRWMFLTTTFSGALSLLCAVWAIGWPSLWFKWSNMPIEGHREMWMTVGLFNGAIGLSLLISSSNPSRYWPNIFIALLAKIGTTTGFLWAFSQGVFPLRAGWVILLNSTLLIPPLFFVLWRIAQVYAGKPLLRETPYTLEEALQRYTLNSGKSLYDVSSDQTIVVVFMRHFGCTFTRQLLRKLGNLEELANQHNTKLVLVHMLQRGEETPYLNRADIARVSDPYCELYRTFGLGKGGLLELFGPTVILQGIMALIKGCGVGHLAGDGLQLPGAFIVKNGKIIRAQRAKTAAELPQLEKLFDSPPTNIA